MSAPFPQYRRSAHGGNYYRIDGPDGFEELQLVGTRVLRHVVEARAYPERLRVQDMLACAEGRYLPVAGDEYRAVAARGGW